MFFIMGIVPQQKVLCETTLICDHCQGYGRFTLIHVCQVFSLFFVPIFKWGHQYYVQSSCCHCTYTIDENKAEAIRRGQCSSFSYEDLTLVRESHVLRCPHCHRILERRSPFCPECGNPLK